MNEYFVRARVILCRIMVFLLMLCCLSVQAADAKPKASDGQRAARQNQPAVEPVSPSVPEVWHPLVRRLAAQGQNKAALENLFAQLPGHITTSPMGTKILELYRSKFIRQPDGTPKPRPKYYKDTITEANARKCRAFIEKNAAFFAEAEEKYGVPSRVAVALLFVETRLGTNVGKRSALYSLASMALSVTPDMLGAWLGKLPEDYQSHLDWMREIMPKRADWAYKELAALTAYMIREGRKADDVPGSVYGALGMCQFMPSNIDVYGADGNADGKVNLFDAPDAVWSLSRYLNEHGWKPGITAEQQHAVLKTYNKSDTYAATILALAEVIAGGPVPSDAE